MPACPSGTACGLGPGRFGPGQVNIACAEPAAPLMKSLHPGTPPARVPFGGHSSVQCGAAVGFAWQPHDKKIARMQIFSEGFVRQLLCTPFPATPDGGTRDRGHVGQRRTAVSDARLLVRRTHWCGGGGFLLHPSLLIGSPKTAAVA